MSSNSTLNLLRRAQREIREQRRAIELLGAQVHIIHVFEAALLGKQEQCGASVDICWELDKEIESLESATKLRTTNTEYEG